MMVLGLDPGGIGQFGWCVAEANSPNVIRVLSAGEENGAAAALVRASQQVELAQLSAAGIDSPLFWTSTSDRVVDHVIRTRMRSLGATHADGTVQRVNSLRGACLVQGVMAARLLRRHHSTLRITETHPKALLWLLKVAGRQCRAADVRMAHLCDRITWTGVEASEHQRDAALGAFAAAAMLHECDGWHNLALVDIDAFAPVSPVEYWMPVAPEA